MYVCAGVLCVYVCVCMCMCVCVYVCVCVCTLYVSGYKNSNFSTHTMCKVEMSNHL